MTTIGVFAQLSLFLIMLRTCTAQPIAACLHCTVHSYVLNSQPLNTCTFHTCMLHVARAQQPLMNKKNCTVHKGSANQQQSDRNQRRHTHKKTTATSILATSQSWMSMTTLPTLMLMSIAVLDQLCPHDTTG